MRVLFVENEDSFSWNVIDALPVSRAQVDVQSGADRDAVGRGLRGASVLVIGPGPRDPLRAGIVDLVRFAADHGLPTLGICLGHQAIGLAFGARLARTTPCHGKRSTFTMLPNRLLPGIDGRVEAMRYHSLSLVDVATPLSTVAATDEGIVMAIEHATLPMLGLQFHPDSYATPRGREMFASFFGAVA